VYVHASERVDAFRRVFYAKQVVNRDGIVAIVPETGRVVAIREGQGTGGLLSISDVIGKWSGFFGTDFIRMRLWVKRSGTGCWSAKGDNMKKTITMLFVSAWLTGAVIAEDAAGSPTAPSENAAPEAKENAVKRAERHAERAREKAEKQAHKAEKEAERAERQKNRAERQAARAEKEAARAERQAARAERQANKANK
jgi:hypothetical protein